MNGCEYCKKPYGKDYAVLPCANGEQGLSASFTKASEEDSCGVVILQRGVALGYFNIEYCPMCGRKLNS